MRAELKGAMLRLEMTAWWLAVNPSDQRNPLILVLAGVEFSHESMPALPQFEGSLQRQIPQPLLKIFYHVCNALFDGLLRTGSDELGILGKYRAIVVETNGRGMFHIHSLVWLAGNFMFEELRTRVLNDPDFADGLISFLESTLTTAIDNALADDGSLLLQSAADLFADRSNEDFCHDLRIDSQSIASKT
jgi:hypothetical protein